MKIIDVAHKMKRMLTHTGQEYFKMIALLFMIDVEHVLPDR